MNDHDIDARLQALFDEPAPAADRAFSDRVIALAAYDLSERRARQAMVRRTLHEALALVVVLVTFVVLARAAPVSADLGDTIPLSSPAMLGLVVVVLWGVTALRSANAPR